MLIKAAGFIEISPDSVLYCLCIIVKIDVKMLSLESKKEIIYTFGECRRNLRTCVRLLRERHPNDNYNYESVRRIVRMFDDSGTVRYSKAVRKRPITGNPDIITLVENSIHENPTISSRRISQENNISKTSVLRILKFFKYHPYKISLTQELHGMDFENRLFFCNFITFSRLPIRPPGRRPQSQRAVPAPLWLRGRKPC